jgi:hypothetical protein
MKKILIFVFLLISLKSHTQLAYLTDLSMMIKQGQTDIDWKTIEKNRDEKLIQAFAFDKKYLRGDCDRFEEQYSPNKSKEARLELTKKRHSDIHTIDINQDGKLDIVYDGVCNPYRAVTIYINRGKNTFKNVFGTKGWISSISVKNGICKIAVKDFACCADITNTLKIYEIKAKSEIIEEKCLIQYPMDMDTPKAFDRISTFEYISKTTPKIKPVKKNKDNFIEFEAKGLNPKGWILNELKNKEGQWYLALFPFKDSENIYTLGWINSVSAKNIIKLE